MPRGDRTGPDGFGPMSGRGMGYCAGNNRPGFMEPGPGMGAARGFGRGHGRGRGFGRGFGRGYRNFAGNGPAYAPVNQQNNAPQTQAAQENEKAYLKNVAKNLENELEAVQQRLDELEKEE